MNLHGKVGGNKVHGRRKGEALHGKVEAKGSGDGKKLVVTSHMPCPLPPPP